MLSTIAPNNALVPTQGGAAGLPPALQQALGGLDPAQLGADSPEAVQELIALIMMLLQSGQSLFDGMGQFAGAPPVGEAGGAGDAGNAGNAGNAGGAGGAGDAGNAGNAGKAGNASGGGGGPVGDIVGGNAGGPTVAVVDDFNSNHGNEIAGIIQAGGASTVGFDVNRSGVSGALGGVIDQLINGQQIDAVNLSQQAFNGNLSEGEFSMVERQINTIQDTFGVPVVVAAGNGGAGAENRLARGASLVVENSAVGSEARSGSSGRGNIRAEGQFTSQATATVSAQAAQSHRGGATVGQVVDGLKNKASSEGGSLDR